MPRPESLRSYSPCRAGVAQLVEQGTENPRVGSSILSPGTIFQRLRVKPEPFFVSAAQRLAERVPTRDHGGARPSWSSHATRPPAYGTRTHLRPPLAPDRSAASDRNLRKSRFNVRSGGITCGTRRASLSDSLSPYEKTARRRPPYGPAPRRVESFVLSRLRRRCRPAGAALQAPLPARPRTCGGSRRRAACSRGNSRRGRP